MAGFFTNLIDKITSVFKSKDLDENINNFFTSSKIIFFRKKFFSVYEFKSSLAQQDYLLYSQ